MHVAKRKLGVIKSQECRKVLHQAIADRSSVRVRMMKHLSVSRNELGEVTGGITRKSLVYLTSDTTEIELLRIALQLCHS